MYNIQRRDPKILFSYKKKFVILSEIKQDRQIDLFKMKQSKLVRIILNTSGNMLRLKQKAKSPLGT